MNVGTLSIELMANIARIQRDMDQARTIVGGAMGNISRAVDIAKAAIGALGVGLSVNFFTNMIRGSIDAADSLNDLKKSTGIAVADLAGLKLAAKQSGGDLEGIAASINKLSVNIGKDGDKFARLGVTAKEPLEAFKQLADVFSAVKDPQTRAAVGAEALGKSWASAAPLLAEGGKKIGEMIETGKQLSGVTQEMADQADEFNDRMAELGSAVEGAKNKIVGDMLPGLVSATTAITNAYEESGKLEAAWVALGAFGALAFTDEFASTATKLKHLRGELDVLKNYQLNAKESVPILGWLLWGSESGWDAEIANKKKDIADIIKAAADSAAVAAKKRESDKQAEMDKAAAKDAADRAAAFIKAGEAASKAMLAANLENIKFGIEADKAKRAEGLAAVAELNRQGLASDALFYIAKYNAAIASGQDIARVKGAEIAALSNYHSMDLADQIATKGKIDKLNLEKNEALRASLAAADMLRKQYMYDADAPVRAAKAAADAEIDTANKESVALQLQYESYDKLAPAITAVAIAKLKAKGAALESNEGADWEIAKNNQLIAALQSRASWQSKVASQDLTKQLSDENRRFIADSIFDEKKRAAALLEIDAQLWRDRISQLGDGSEAQKLLQGKYLTWYQNQLLKPQLDADKAMWASIESTAHDTFVSIFDSGKSAFNRLRDTLKNGLLDLLYQMTIKKWILNIGASVTGGGVGGIAQAAGGAGDMANGASSLLGNISSAGSLYNAYTSSSLGQFMSGFSGSAGAASEMLGGAPLTGAAQYGQTAANGLSGAGGAAPYLGMAAGGMAAWQASQGRGAVGGGVVGGLAGAGTIAAGGALTGTMAGTGAMAGATAALAAVPVWGWIAIAALAILGGMQDGPEQATRLAFGSNNKAGAISINERGNEGKSNEYVADAFSKGAFGSFGVVSTFWMDATQPAVKSFVQTVTQTDDAMAKFMTSTELAAAAAALTGHTMTSNSGAEGSDPNGLGGLDAVFRDRITTIFNTVDPALNAMLDGFKGTSQELATEATALLDYRKNLPAASEAIFGAVVTLQDLAALRAPTESVSSALMRVTNAFTATNAVIEPLGVDAATAFGAVGLASLEARQRLIDAAGGVNVLSAGAANFAQSFLTDAEKLAPVVEALGKRMGDLGYAGVNTAEGYKNVVMGLVSSGALATAAGANTYVELLKLTSGFSLLGTAAKTATDETNSILGIQSQMYDAMGDKAGAAAVLEKQHTAALVGMSPALAEATKALWKAEAAAAALAKIKNDATAALGGVDDAYAVVQKVVDRQKTALTTLHDFEMKNIQKRIDAQTKLVESLKPLSDSLHSTLDSMKIAGTETADRSGAQAQIKAALAIANAGGPLPTADALKKSLGIVSQDASALFATYQDYQRDFYSTQNDIASLSKLSDSSLSVEQQTLDALIGQKDAAQLAYDEEIKRLDGVVDTARMQVEYLKGMDISLVSIDQAMMNLAGSILAAKANPIVAATATINSAYQSALGRPPEAQGLEFWQKQAAGGMTPAAIAAMIADSPEAQVQSLYQSVLGRPGEASGVDFWMKALGSGMSVDAAKVSMMQSDEYKKAHPIPGFASGGDFGGGLRIVGENGPELESTGPSRIHSTRDLMANLRNPSESNAVLVAAVDRLTKTVEQQAEALDKIARETKRQADGLEVVTDGFNAMRTKEQPA